MLNYLLMYLKVLLVGGTICAIGELIIITTKLTPARILVVFLMIGAVLGGLNVYQYLKEPKYFISFSIVICLLISIIDETIQTFVDGRSGSIIDVGIDSLGFLLSILILAIIIINVNKKKEQTIS